MTAEDRFKFISMPNFRELGILDEVRTGTVVDAKLEGDRVGCETNTSRPLRLYRSSRPDFLTADEVKRFQELGFRSIIDFRSATEYRKATGNKLLDTPYPVYKVKLPFYSRYKHGEEIKFVPVRKPANGTQPVESVGPATQETTKDGDVDTPESEKLIGKHYLINFFRFDYAWSVFRRAAWYIQLYSLLFLLLDIILRTGFRYFVSIFARYVLNKEGLVWQYITMIEHSRGAIYAALKLLSDPANVPAMLNCAHGKDRTGIVSALVLACLGKSKEYIATDYARSETELEVMRDRLCAEIVEKFSMSQSFMTAKYETMMHVLDYIDESYGSVANYLESLGFNSVDQERLRQTLRHKG